MVARLGGGGVPVEMLGGAARHPGGGDPLTDVHHRVALLPASHGQPFIGATVGGEASSVSDQLQLSTEQNGNAARPLRRGTNFTAGKAKESAAEAALCYFYIDDKPLP